MIRCKLRQVLKDQGITQAELAKRTGLTEAAISLIAAGKRSCNLESALVILKALSCRLEEIWEV